uniref:Uncharacterized protein n=1 Tax=Mycena chlorophos TaxID=658473 RepID=A0ABQ0L1U2_MYCCL|nr:predicted protein [Mycena chlorophos]
MAPVFFLATLFASLAASASAIANIRCTPVTGQKMDVSWTSDVSDSSPMSLALVSAAEDSRNPGGLVLADNVSPHDQSITVHLPTVEPGAYIISLISTPKRARARAPGPNAILGSSSPFHILARQDSSSSGSSSSSSTLPPLSKSSSKLSASFSAIESSLSAAESSQLSSASSAFSAGASNISSAVSARSSASAAQSSATSSATTSGSAAVAVRLMGTGVGAALLAVLGGVAVGAALL